MSSAGTKTKDKRWTVARLNRMRTLCEYVKRQAQELADEIDPERDYEGDDSGLLRGLQALYTRAGASLTLIEVLKKQRSKP